MNRSRPCLVALLIPIFCLSMPLLGGGKTKSKPKPDAPARPDAPDRKPDPDRPVDRDKPVDPDRPVDKDKPVDRDKPTDPAKKPPRDTKPIDRDPAPDPLRRAGAPAPDAPALKPPTPVGGAIPDGPAKANPSFLDGVISRFVDRAALNPSVANPPSPTARYFDDVSRTLSWNKQAIADKVPAEQRAKTVFMEVMRARERVVEALPAKDGAPIAKGLEGPFIAKYNGLVERGKADGRRGDALYEWVIKQSAMEPISPARIKDWELADPKQRTVEANPSLVRLEKLDRPGEFRPVENVTYLWVLGSKGELRVGIETQAKDGKSNQLYGHPTLVYDIPGYKAMYAGEMYFKKNVGWVLNADSGRFGKNRPEGMERRTEAQARELMSQARMLFQNYANLDVKLGERFGDAPNTKDLTGAELKDLLRQDELRGQ